MIGFDFLSSIKNGFVKYMYIIPGGHLHGTFVVMQRETTMRTKINI